MTNQEEERERAMFQPVDRQYLAGEKQYATDQGEYNRREQIRNRVKGAVRDFIPVQRKLTEWNWRKFIDMDRSEEMQFRDGMVAAIAFFYEFHQTMGWDFGTTLRDAIDEAHTHGTERQMSHRIVDGVEFEPKTKEPEEYRRVQGRINEKVENGEELTHHEKSVAVDMGGPILHKVREHIEERSERKSRERAFRKISEDVERHGHPDDR